MSVRNHDGSITCVVLLHGLARTDRSMKKLASALFDAGFSVINIGYPSTRYSIEHLAQQTFSPILAACNDYAICHFVSHSMGGLLLRQYLHKNQIHNLGRVVMLGPPNKGSQVVDKISDIPGFKMLNGPAGMQLGTGKSGITHCLGPTNFELGIIAGTQSINPILSLMLPTPNDGKVSVDSTKIDGMTDHIEIPVNHSFMMNNKRVIQQVIFFLKNARFNKSENS